MRLAALPRQLAAKGVRAFPVDLPFRPLQNAGWDRDLKAAVDYLRRIGAASVVLIGASMGGAAAMVAAAEISPPVDGVVNLSGERRVSGLDADTALRRSAVPLLIIASDSDLNAHDARALYMTIEHMVFVQTNGITESWTEGGKTDLSAPGAEPLMSEACL